MTAWQELYAKKIKQLRPGRAVTVKLLQQRDHPIRDRRQHTTMRPGVAPEVSWAQGEIHARSSHRPPKKTPSGRRERGPTGPARIVAVPHARRPTARERDSFQPPPRRDLYSDHDPDAPGRLEPDSSSSSRTSRCARHHCRPFQGTASPDRPDRHALGLGEQVPAVAREWPVLDDLIGCGGRQQIPPPPFMPVLRAPLAPRRILAALGRLARPIGTRRTRRVLGVLRELGLQHRDPLALTLNHRGQLLDLAVHPQQHPDDDLSPRVIDRPSLFALHTTRFHEAMLCPPPTERLRNAAARRGGRVLRSLHVFHGSLGSCCGRAQLPKRRDARVATRGRRAAAQTVSPLSRLERPTRRVGRSRWRCGRSPRRSEGP
jgi:hypothetical protein